MNYTVFVLPRAEQDFEEIHSYIRARSAQGAASWANAFYAALKKLETNPNTYGLAPESGEHEFDLRQLIFKTRRGNAYRALFTVEHDKVFIRHIRGTGQDLISP